MINAELFERIARESLCASRDIDLSDAHYGVPNWDNAGDQKAITTPIDYYFFLVGLVRSMQFKKIIEIGTHMGGSAKAMARGFQRPLEGGERVVTIDVTDSSDQALAGEKEIVKIKGSAENPETLLKVKDALQSETADMIFIDGNHHMDEVLHQFGVYRTLFSPRCVVFDDIGLNDSMKDFWKLVMRSFPGKAANMSDVSQTIRESRCGFGLLLLEKPRISIQSEIDKPETGVLISN